MMRQRPAEIPLTRAPTVIPHNAINIFKDGSKTGGRVGAAAVIIKVDTVLHQYKYKLHGRCSNNQAEHVAIQRAQEQIRNLLLSEGTGEIVVVNTGSKVTLDTVEYKQTLQTNREYKEGNKEAGGPKMVSAL